MLVRKTVPSELDALAQVWYDGWQDAHAAIVPVALTRLCTFESFRERLADALPNVRVVGPPGDPWGFCIVKDDELYQLFVAAHARGTGAAVALIRDAETRLAESGVETAWLACAIGNDRAARFYEKNGWHRAGTMIQPRGDEQRCVFARSLAVREIDPACATSGRGSTWARTGRLIRCQAVTSSVPPSSLLPRALSIGSGWAGSSASATQDAPAGLDAEVQSYELEALDSRLKTIPTGVEHDYAAGILAARSARADEAVGLLTRTLPGLRQAHPARAAHALEALADSYMLLYRYREAADAYRDLKDHFPGVLQNDVTDDAALAQILAGAQPQTIDWSGSLRLPTTRNPIGSLVSTLEAGGVREDWLLDTGANQSVVSRSFAKRLGLELLVGSASVGFRSHRPKELAAGGHRAGASIGRRAPPQRRRPSS